MTTIYLAYASRGDITLAKHAEDGPVDMLVAFPYFDLFQKRRGDFNVGKLCMDSGAFSVHNSGHTIDIKDYIDTVKAHAFDEVFALDVIGDAKQTRANAERMWAEGIDAIPTFHYGSDWADLEWCAKHADKIALGGVARLKGHKKIRFLCEAMQRVWPKRVHAFGCTSRGVLAVAPWHSVDSSSWQYGPAAVGVWQGLSGKPMAVKSRGITDFWAEVLEYRKRSRWAAHRWRKQLKELENPQ